MLPTQIGDVTDTDSLEQMVYFTYWLESFMAWVL
jgi:hypothetical protein